MLAYDQIALDIRHEAGSTVSSATIGSYFKAFWDVCVSYFNAYPFELFEPGKVVKIDETVLARRKIIKKACSTSVVF